MMAMAAVVSTVAVVVAVAVAVAAAIIHKVLQQLPCMDLSSICRFKIAAPVMAMTSLEQSLPPAATPATPQVIHNHGDPTARSAMVVSTAQRVLLLAKLMAATMMWPLAPTRHISIHK